METIENPTIVDHVPQTAKEQRVSLFEQINLNVFWLTNNFHWQALLAIVIPSMVAKFEVAFFYAKRTYVTNKE